MQGGVKNQKDLSRFKFYESKTKLLPGTKYREIKGRANEIYKKIEKQTKRRPYIRSAYFRKEKIFFDYFWTHLRQKREKDKVRRLKIFPCGLELIMNSRFAPEININRNRSSESLYKFGGLCDGKKFYVQIKENKKTGTKYLMSCFPED